MRRLGDFRRAQRAFAEVLLVGVTRVLVIVAVQAYLTVRHNGMRHKKTCNFLFQEGLDLFDSPLT